MSESTSAQRQNWAAYECAPDKMIRIPFGPDTVRVAPPTKDAFAALAQVLEAHKYVIRTPDTDSYNCREIKSGGGRSLHSYGIALDVNWDSNPYKTTPDQPLVKFSGKPTQDERREDVRLGRADTDMTPAMIADVLKIKTNNGKQVFEWGGNWKTVKDTMHFEIDITPNDLKSGIDQNTVVGDVVPELPTDGHPMLRLGSRGEEVKYVQQHLLADGIFDDATEGAVKAFQRARGLSPDGIVGPLTWAALTGPPPVAEGWNTNIKSTTFGGNADTELSAYDGHRITETELGVALPYRFVGARPLIELRNPSTGTIVTANVVDVGPWNISDNYWTRGSRPQAEGGSPGAPGTDLKGRKTNGAGIDLTPGAVRALGFTYSSAWSGMIDWRIKPDPKVAAIQIAAMTPEQPKETLMATTVNVAVKPATESKINWTQIVGLAASVAVVFGLDIPVEHQAALVTVIQAVQAAVTVVFKTWFTSTVTPQSVK